MIDLTSTLFRSPQKTGLVKATEEAGMEFEATMSYMYLPTNHGDSESFILFYFIVNLDLAVLQCLSFPVSLNRSQRV